MVLIHGLTHSRIRHVLRLALDRGRCNASRLQSRSNWRLCTLREEHFLLEREAANGVSSMRESMVADMP